MGDERTWLGWERGFFHQISVRGDFLHVCSLAMLFLVLREVKVCCITTLERRRRRRRRRRMVYVMARLSTAQYAKQEYSVSRTNRRDIRHLSPSSTSLSLSTDVSAKERRFDPVHTDQQSIPPAKAHVHVGTLPEPSDRHDQ